jgi:hypothetical protein
MTGSRTKDLSEPKDFRGKLVRYTPDGQLGIITELCWFQHSIRNHYVIVLQDGTKRTVSLNDESSLVELV